MSGEQSGFDGRIVQAQAPVSGVSVPRHLGVGSDLTHSLDYVVMLQVMFNLASQTECTPVTVWQQLKERGIRSAKNADELVGKNAVHESFARLIAAGYIRRTRVPHPTKPGRLGPMVYEVFDNPAWNPGWEPAAENEGQGQVKPQVGTRPGTPDLEFREEDKTAGQNTSRNAGRGNTRSGVLGRGTESVSAGQNTSGVPGRGMASPPHPPEEVTTSSPFPLTDTSGHRPAAPGEEGEVFDPRETAAAARFLQTLPQPWCVGRVKAKALAPVLLEAMSDQGWPKLADLDDRARVLLVQQLTKNPTGVRNHGSVLERDRVPNLPLFDVVAGAGVGIPAQGSVGVPGPPPAVDPGYKPVPPPPDVAALLAGLRKPTV